MATIVTSIDLLNAELRRTARPPLKSHEYALLRDPARYDDAIVLIDGLEFRGAISSHVRAEVADALTHRPMSTLADIQTAVRNGQRVHWKNEAYTVGRWVRKDDSEQWLIVHANGSSTGLTRADGVTMNEKPADFFIGA